MIPKAQSADEDADRAGFSGQHCHLSLDLWEQES
jgi:hypothetical protein